ncbi:hypothetical protein AB0G02_17225 [Actinosynnema sp. NPDC023658]|uniref:hypothetical protein n=1 Tax=Actinosynnema sp. NPDC023658 TaxID=3155465 RepID=UPI0033D59E3D
MAQNLFDDPRKPVGDYVVTAESPAAGGPVVVNGWASGGTPISVTRTSTGRYRAHFANGSINSTVHASSTVPGNRCTVVQFNDYSFKDDTTILVGCTDAGGTPVNSGFDLVYSSARIY